MEGGCEGADAGERRVLMAGRQAGKTVRDLKPESVVGRGRDGKDWEGCERRAMGR